MHSEVLELVRCPQTAQRLRLASVQELQTASQASGISHTHGLVTEDGALFYPVTDDIPALIPSSAIQLTF